MKVLVIVLLLILAAAAATFIKYRSFSPCDWMEHDLVEDTGFPPIAIQARIRAYFLLQGIVDPDPAECLLEWWKVRREGLPEQQ